ncbi:hypothetical protein [Desulforegula conservatrix]|uniref:hypothetical protein n=1 Tax=Desulforegula conservatrix TaxID=153026 RepID=UPI000402A804|nr:hypothetical protein [Desulforegula conservatrix]
MTKINNIPEQLAAIRQKAAVSNTQNSSDAFSKALRDVMSGTKVPETSSEITPEATGPVLKSTGINPSFMRLNDSTTISEVMSQTDQLLTRLDDYAKLLEDPSSTLKDMEPVIDSIKKDADALNADAEKKLPEGSGIKKVVREFAIAANAEYFRFKRGDYA